MWAAAYGRDSPVENARVFPDIVYELWDRIDRKARVNNEGRWRPDDGADRNETLLAPAKFRVHSRVGHGRGAEESPGVSVRLGTRDLFPGEVSVCARLRFDHDRLVPNLGKLVGNDTRGDVGDSTRRIGHDHVDRPVRKVGLRMPRACDQHPSARPAAEQRDELAPSHSITSSARSRNGSGIVSPSAFAVVRLMMRSNFVGCSTGMSLGFVPRRILSTNSAARRYRSGMLGPKDIRPPASTYSRTPCMVGSRAPSASVLMRTRLVFMSGSAGTYSASARPLSASKAGAISSPRRISSAATSRPSVWAAT